MTIIEQARRVLARIENLAPYETPASVITIAEASALCRALIARDKALREYFAAKDQFVAASSNDPPRIHRDLSGALWASERAARRALQTDEGEPPTGQGD